MNEAKTYDTTNTCISYIENGLFAKAGVEALQRERKPILKLKINVDGKDVEVALYFKMVYDTATGSFTDQYKVTSSGSKMLGGKVVAPWVADVADAFTSVDDGLRDMGRDEPEDEIPF